MLPSGRSSISTSFAYASPLANVVVSYWLCITDILTVALCAPSADSSFSRGVKAIVNVFFSPGCSVAEWPPSEHQNGVSGRLPPSPAWAFARAAGLRRS